MAGLERGQTIGVKVERVVDGDTVRVRRAGWWTWLMPGEAIVVRLYGIDAPESQQLYGDQSTAALRKFLKGQGKLMLEAQDTDRYGRTVGLLYREGPGREQSANLRMVQEGWAYAYTQYGGSELGFRQAERDAQRQKAGVWRNRGNRDRKNRPWQYRADRRAGDRRRVKIRMLLVSLILVAVAGAGVYVKLSGW